jgi:single-strand DNA-binding protein
MKGSYSQIIVAGSLSKEPEMRYTPSGKPVTTFSIPVNRGWKDQAGQWVNETTWHNITTWGNSAEACKQKLSKGSVILVVGRLQPDKNTGNPRTFTRQDGSIGASFEITAQEVKFLYTAADGTEQEYHGMTQPGEIPIDEDEIPF